MRATYKGKLLVLLISWLALAACTSTDVATQPAELGRMSNIEEMLSVVNDPGPIVFNKYVAADWEVPLSGLLNLKHEQAIHAGLEDRDEPIQIYVYSIKHPESGTFLVDSGVSERFKDPLENADVSYLVKKAMSISTLKTRRTTAEIQDEVGEISGVFLSHIHFDHIMGLTDLNTDVPIYIGPGDTEFTSLTHLATRGSTNRLLANVSVLREWQFDKNGVIDVFGDGSFWAIHVPGHTPGATAYLARTADGPQLMIGDATHTRWGWDNGVEPGSYSENGPQSAESLLMLKQLADGIPGLKVHPGHQP